MLLLLFEIFSPLSPFYFFFLPPPIDRRRVFTPTTRASVETLQQQYGLPINGVWGSLERQIFDNARIRTLPPQSAEALLPPDYNKSKANTKYSTAVSSHTQNLMPKSLNMPGAEIPDGVGGVVAMAGAGLFTAAMITKADSVRREGGRNNGPRGGDPRVFPRHDPQRTEWVGGQADWPIA